MKKKLIFLYFLLFPCLTNALDLPVDITAESAIVVNLDSDEVVYTKNPDDEVILASLTKIMTAYTVIENVSNLNQKVTITKEDLYNLYGFTFAGLEEGDKVSYLDLLYAMMLPSGADASQALAIHTAGSAEKFNEMMASEVEKLGLRRTHFADSFGRDDANVSTAREMSYLIKRALENETFKNIFQTDYYTLSNGLRVVNYTDSIATFHGLDYTLLTGSKAGYTEVADLLLASTSYINNTNYLVIVCKSKINEYLSTHVLDTYKILNYLKSHSYSKRNILKKGTILKTIPVEESTISEYVVIADKDLYYNLTEEEFNKIHYEYHIADKLSPANKLGDNIGFVDILIDDYILDTYHISLKEDFFSRQKESKILILIIVLLAFFALVLFGTNIMFKKRK